MVVRTSRRLSKAVRSWQFSASAVLQTRPPIRPPLPPPLNAPIDVAHTEGLNQDVRNVCVSTTGCSHLEAILTCFSTQQATGKAGGRVATAGEGGKERIMVTSLPTKVDSYGLTMVPSDLEKGATSKAESEKECEQTDEEGDAHDDDAHDDDAQDDVQEPLSR